MSRLDSNGYYAVGIPAYVLLLLLEARYFQRRGRRSYPMARTLSNLSTSLGAVVVGLFFAPLFFWLYDFGLAHVALIRWPEGSPVPWVLGVVASDFCYYWHHRAGHRVGALWAIHQVHHQCDRFDLSVALRHPWLSDLSAIPFYALMPMLGVSSLQFFLGVSIVSFYAITIHSPMFARPSLFGLLVTPASHIVHHARNPRYLGKNLGAMFTLWDRLFGTYTEIHPNEPPQIGTTRGYPTHDGVLAQWAPWADLVSLGRGAATWQERIMPFVGPPGWRRPGTALPRRQAPPHDDHIPRATCMYVLAQFAVLVAFAAHLLWLRDQHSLGWQLVGAAVVVVGLGSLGGLLDGRRGARRAEAARIAVTLVALGVLSLSG